MHVNSHKMITVLFFYYEMLPSNTLDSLYKRLHKNYYLGNITRINILTVCKGYKTNFDMHVCKVLQKRLTKNGSRQIRLHMEINLLITRAIHITTTEATVTFSEP